MVDARVVHPVHPNLQGAIHGRNLMGVIPLQIICTPVVQIHCLPVWIIARPERPSLLLELVAEYQDKLFVGVMPPFLRVRLLRGVAVNQPIVAWDGGDLSSCVDATEVETTLSAVLDFSEVADERETW